MRKNLKIPSWVIACVDALLVNAATLFTYLIRFKGVLPEANILPFYRLSPFIAISTVMIYGFLDMYKRDWDGVNRNLPTIVVASFLVFLVTNAATFWIRGFAFPRSVLLLSFFVQIVVIWFWRTALWRVESKFQDVLDVIVVGSSGDKELFEKIDACSKYSDNYRIRKKICVENVDITQDELEGADVLFVLPSVNEEKKLSLLEFCLRSNKTIFIVPRLYDIIVSTAEIKQFDDIPVFEVSGLKPSLSYSLIKRALDIVVATCGLALAAPIMLLIAIAIKLTSPGPVLYVQERVGFGGKPFLLYKFRTMVDNAEKYTGPVLATSDDPRITPVGRFLRLTRLDELPQLWNVLKGDMSLVGPRPERPVFVEKFTHEIPAYVYRHRVKPGLTGLAQVAGKYTTRTHDKLRYDLFYIRSQSIFQDLKIILKTITVVMNKEAAQGQKGEVSAGLQASGRAKS